MLSTGRKPRTKRKWKICLANYGRWRTSCKVEVRGPEGIACKMTWVSWAANPGLASYLIHSQASLYASTLTKDNLLSYEPECEEIMALRGAIFDKLFYHTTAAGDVGVSPAIVEISFSRASLQAFLGKGAFYGHSIDFSGCFPISIRCERWELDACFASTEIGSTTWYERTFDTTTSCVVDPNSPLSISCGYRVREQHIHSLCPRCSHSGEEIDRPSVCQTETVCLPNFHIWQLLVYIELELKKGRFCLNNDTT